LAVKKEYLPPSYENCPAVFFQTDANDAKMKKKFNIFKM
jgi:hypothetical protein